MIYETENAIKGLLLTDAQSTLAEFVEGLTDHSVEDVKSFALDFVIRNDGLRVTSRSTSVIGNLVADVRRAVAAAVVEALTRYEEKGLYEDASEWLASHMVHRLTDIVR